MHEQVVPTLWLKRLYGVECKPTGECYDIAFSPVAGYVPLYEIPADQALVPRATLERFMQKIHSAAQYDDVKAARAELRALLQR